MEPDRGRLAGVDRARVRVHARHVRGYVELFRGVFARASAGIVGRRESYLITMAGLAASRIFAAGGAGGLVLQAWALRQAGLARRVVADKTISFLILTYFPYAAAVDRLRLRPAAAGSSPARRRSR